MIDLRVVMKRRKTYPLELTDLQTVRLPKGAMILEVLSIGNHVALHVEENPEEPSRLRYIQMLPKGEPAYIHRDAVPMLLGHAKVLGTEFDVVEAVF